MNIRAPVAWSMVWDEGLVWDQFVVFMFLCVWNSESVLLGHGIHGICKWLILWDLEDESFKSKKFLSLRCFYHPHLIPPLLLSSTFDTNYVSMVVSSFCSCCSDYNLSWLSEIFVQPKIIGNSIYFRAWKLAHRAVFACYLFTGSRDLFKTWFNVLFMHHLLFCFSGIEVQMQCPPAVTNQSCGQPCALQILLFEHMQQRY